MASAITGTSQLASAPTAYSGSNSSLNQAIQTIWSKEILFQAMPVLRFEQFAVKKTELGVMPGLTINFMRYNNLPIPAGPLVEGIRMKTHGITAQQYNALRLLRLPEAVRNQVRDGKLSAGHAKALLALSTPELQEKAAARADMRRGAYDPTGKADRLDRFMGVENGRFFLSHGGFVNGFTPFGERFSRTATGSLPALPEIPGQ